MSNENKNQHEQEEKSGHDKDRLVHITIDGECFEVRKGIHKVVEIKRIGHVPEAYVLVQDVKGRLVPLPDDGEVHIKGCEIFESHPRDGGSS